MIHTANEGSMPGVLASGRASSRASSAKASSSTIGYDTASSSGHASSSSAASSSLVLPLPPFEQPSFEAMIVSATASLSTNTRSTAYAEPHTTGSAGDAMPQPCYPSLQSTTVSSSSQSTLTPPLLGELVSSAKDEEPRPQAEPLPSKRGEIGFREDLHRERPRSARIVETLPERHPADRRLPTPTVGASAGDVNETPRPASTTETSMGQKKGILGFFKPKRVPSYGGLRLTTLLIFFGQICLIAGTITAWVIAVKRVKPGANQTGPQLQGTSSFIFVHVVFAIAVLGQLLFLERRVFRLRAERYMYLHPGAVLPTSYHGMAGSIDPAIIALSPWNRPPLPTYAAALQQSGAGTGDVEDHIIAAPPPPAYGNTRGSTLLLAGFMRQSLQVQRPASVHSQFSIQRSIAPGERPVSYASRDQQWEEYCDAERARRLEETLSRLERNSSQVSHHSRELGR